MTIVIFLFNVKYRKKDLMTIAVNRKQVNYFLFCETFFPWKENIPEILAPIAVEILFCCDPPKAETRKKD